MHVHQQTLEAIILWAKFFSHFHKAKLKEEKEAKRALLDERHIYLFTLIANRLDLEINQVQDFLLDKPQV